MGKRKRKEKEVLDEETRKAMQRSKQAKARADQSKGLPTKRERKAQRKDQPPKTTTTTTTKSPGTAWREKEFAGRGRNDFRKERRQHHDDDVTNRRVHDVVIIPIFWRDRPGEEDAMVGEAQRLKEMIRRHQKLDVWIDRTHKMSPGQKFAFWDNVGVKCRIDLGPDDAKQHQCVIVACATKKKTTVSSIHRVPFFNELRRIKASVPRILPDPDADQVEASRSQAILDAWLSPGAQSGGGGGDSLDDGSGSRPPPPEKHRISSSSSSIDVNARRSTRLDPSRNDDELDDDDAWVAAAGSDDDDD